MRNSVTTENLLDLAAFIQKAAEKGHMENEAILIHAQHDIEGFLTPDFGGLEWLLIVFQ